MVKNTLVHFIIHKYNLTEHLLVWRSEAVYTGPRSKRTSLEYVISLTELLRVTSFRKYRDAVCTADIIVARLLDPTLDDASITNMTSVVLLQAERVGEECVLSVVFV
jgi:hypothetical protein